VSLNWSSVRAEHVIKACELALSTPKKPDVKENGLYIVHLNQILPAKYILRLAYCIANNLPMSSKLKFASGESNIRLLKRLGFSAGRRMTRSASCSV
jgi:hypothetical protein